MAFLTNRLRKNPLGLQLRGQLWFYTKFPFNPKTSQRDWEPISVAKVDRESLEKKSVYGQVLEVAKSRAYFGFPCLNQIL